MKRMTRVMYTIMLLLCLSGCALEVNPDTPTKSATEPSKTAETTGVTQPLGTTQDATEAITPTKVPAEAEAELEAWEDNEIRAMLPAPPGKIFQYTGRGLEIGISDASYDELKGYCEQLLSMGFDAYYFMDAYEYSTGPQFDFYGRNVEGIVVRVATRTVFHSGAEIKLDDFRVEEDTKEYEPWGADEFQQLLPDPGCRYGSAQVYQSSYEGQTLRQYTVRFGQAMGYEKLKEYAQALRSAGFIYGDTVDNNPFTDTYAFSARNAEGYQVYLSGSNGTSSDMILYEPGSNNPFRDWEDDPFRAFLPEPICSNFTQKNTTISAPITQEFLLEGMDYESAKAYAQALVEKGYTNIRIEEDDPNAHTYVFEVSGTAAKTGDPSRVLSAVVKLVFDPSQTLDDGSPYCILTYDP